MTDSRFLRSVSGVAILIAAANAASVASSCSTTLTADYAAPSLAKGYVARLVAQDLTYPRGIKFDSEDNLLVVESGKGVTALTFNDAEDGCISETNRKTVIEDAMLNHGIEISEDGALLYASSSEAAYRWDYDGKSRSTTSDSTTLVDSMEGSDHTTRTMVLSRKTPGMLVIARGSFTNIDLLALDKSTGVSQVKAFDLNKMNGPYNYLEQGLLLGWGLRNEVGLGEEPTKGGIYGVENSVDELERDGIDIHNTNPAEELNFLGYLDGTESSNQGRNFGYPDCCTAWDVGTIKGFSGKVGQQFAVGNFSANSTGGDSMCSEAHRQAPRLAFHPHMAPLDILFNDEGSAAFVTFHGSWNSDIPVGYKVSVLSFENGEPTEPSTSKTAAVDIFSNHDVTKCTDDGPPCVRPVGLAWDSKGRLFMSSDETGEIYAILRTDGKPTTSVEGGLPGGKNTESLASLTGPIGMTTLALILCMFAFMM